MSMMYCHKHDRYVDTDRWPMCLECEREEAEYEEKVTPLRSVELIRSEDIGGADPDMFTLAARTVSDEARKAWTMPERDHGRWYVVYCSSDIHGVLKDALDLIEKASVHHEYAIGTPRLPEAE